MSLENKLKILVVEDKKENQIAAEKMLSDYDVTIADSYDVAMDYLKDENNNYDAVLTDMNMPQGRGDCQADKSVKDDILPFGYAIAMFALKEQVPYIGIVSDSNHHNDQFAYTLDFLRGYQEEGVYQIGSSKIVVEDKLANCLPDGRVISDPDFDEMSDEDYDQFRRLDDAGQTTLVKDYKCALHRLLN